MTFHRNKEQISLQVKNIRHGDERDEPKLDISLKHKKISGTHSDKNKVSNLQNFTKIKDSVVVLNSKGVLGAGDGSLTFKGNATQDTHS